VTNLTESASETYEREGYVHFPEAVDHDLIGEASNHVDWLLKKNPGLRPEQLGHTLMTDDPFWVRLISDDRLLDIAEQFIGPDIALFASHYICKPPFDGQPVLWHQDGSYWPLDPMEVVTLWLAVDDSLPENGCMRVIPRTHNSQLQTMHTNTSTPNVLSSGMDASFVEEEKAVDFVLRAGGVSVHHPNLIHGSNANHSALRRCGLTIRYIPATTKILTRSESDTPFPSAFLLRGNASPGVNAYNPRPRYRSGVHMPFCGCEAWE